jgi:hypothetical protein
MKSFLGDAGSSEYEIRNREGKKNPKARENADFLR